MKQKKYKVVTYDNGPTVPAETVVYEGHDEEAARSAYDSQTHRTSSMFECEQGPSPFPTTLNWATVSGRSVIGDS